MNRRNLTRLLIAAAFSAAAVWPALAAEQKPEADEITNEQMVSIYEKGSIGKDVWVVDSRPAGKYMSGHIPGSFSIPLDVLKKDFASIQKLSIPAAGKVVFYCAGRECTLSSDSADIFRQKGYTDVWVYRNGVPGWNQKAQPLLVDVSFIKKGNLILLDTSTEKDTIVTPTNQTVRLSIDDLKGAKGAGLLGSLSKNAPIVVVSRGDMAAVNAALEMLRELDFRRIAYFPVAAWKDKLSQAPALASVDWAPVYEPGQVSPKAFEEAVASGKFIVDVRPAKDFERGHFKGAVNVPIEEMDTDFVKIPKDVPVFVSCATGAKSQKTHLILGRKGYNNVSYLDAEVSCKAGVCSIKE